MSRGVPISVLPSRKLRMNILYLLMAICALALLLLYIDIPLADLVVDRRFITDLLHQMWPPNFALYWTRDILFISVLETLAIAFLGTVLGCMIGLLLAFLAASNTTPHILVQRSVRAVLAVTRSLPPLIVILVLLVAAGIGPFASVLTLALNTMGAFGKLFADSIEQIEKPSLESVQSVGATHAQMIRYAVLPQFIPSFVANFFYALDTNLRTAIPLGIFGGGGIGFELEYANGLLKYPDVIAYTLLIILMINVMERISDRVRRQVLA